MSPNAIRRVDLSIRAAALLGVSVAALGVAALMTAGRANPLNPTASDSGVIYTGLGTTNTNVDLDKQNTIINWNSFNVSSGDTTRFVFGGNNWIVLNRLNGPGSATINGNLLGCLNTSCSAIGGNIWIYASDGVVIGPNARVNVGGFLATTSPIGSDSDFLNGGGAVQDQFDFGASVPGSSVQVQSGAQISASSGSVALVAPQVSTAAGSSISAKGNVLYGAAQSYRIKFAQSGSDDLDLVDFEVPAGRAAGTDSKKPISIAGNTRAANVFVASVSKTDVADAIIDVSGTVTASKATQQGGDIVLSGDGDVSVSGNLSGSNVSVSSTGGTTTVSGSIAAQQNSGAGGSITVTAPNVVVAQTGSLDASGTSGGTVLIGGDVHGGANPGEDFSPTPIANANTTTVAAGATISANGTAGAGGKVVVWSNDDTLFAGTIFAKGNGGSGGFVETSGAQLSVSPTASVNTSSNSGATGTWLLDPASWTIANSGGDITPAQIVTDLESSNLTLNATSFISVTDTIDATSDAAAIHSLFLQAPSIDLHCGCSILLNGGDLDLNGAVTVNQDFILAAGTVTFDSTLDGAHALTVNGNAVFDGVVGGNAPLASLMVNGGSTFATTAITTTGTQEYNGAVTLSSDTNLSGTTVTFDSTIDGGQALTVAGDAVLDGEVGVGTELTSLDVTGTTNINTDAIETSGNQTYEGAVTLSSDTNLTSDSGLVNFQSTVDGGQALTVTGAAEFDGEVGVGTELSSLDVTGTTDINTDAIETTGDQTYEGAATLDAGSTLTSGGLVDFQSTLDGANTLKIAGNAEFDGEVGVGTELTSLDVTGTTDINTDAIKTTGDQTYEGVATLASDTTLTSGGLVDFQSTLDGANTLKIAGNAEFDDEVGAGTKLTSLDITGTTDINTDAIKTTGDQTYEGAATLDAGSTLTSGGLVDFQSTLDGANTLKIAGNAEFDGEVGAGTKLTSLDVTGTTDINTDAIETTGDQTYEGAATLDAGSTLTSGGLVDFQSTLDGANTLKISGNAEFDGEVGAGTKLTSLDITGTTDINTDAIKTTGDQTYEGAATLDAGSTLTSGGLVDFQSTLDGANTLKIAGNAEFDGEVGAGTKLTSLDVTGTTDINTDAIKTTGDQTYEGAATLDAGSTLTSGGLVDFQSTLDGGNTLKIAGNAEFDGEVGAGTKLTSLDVTGTTDINTDAIKTTGDQTYEGAATLSSDTTLTSGGLVDFESTLDGGNTLKIAGNAEFDGEVGVGTELTSLDVTGTTDINTDAITTSGNQTYEGAVTLSSDTNLTSDTGLVNFQSTVDGGQALTVTGAAEFDGEVGVGTKLSSLDVTGTTDINTDAIETTGDQTYEGAATLDAGSTLTSGGLVDFQSTLDGANTLKISGNAEFDGEVGAGTKLTSLDITGTTDINTDAIKTTGDQTYEGAATLDAGSTLTSGGLVDFQSTLDGANTLKIAGNAEFDGEVGVGTELTSLDVTGTTDINTDAIKTTGDQTYEGAVTLDTGSTLTSGGLVDFQSTLDGANTLKIAGNAEFDGEVGVGTELSSLDVTGTTDINTDAIETTGDQTYEGAATLDAGSTLTSGGLVDFQSTLDGANTLKIAGNAEFDGEVGVGTELTSLDVTGTTDINTDAIKTTGDQTYEGVATLASDTTLTSGGLVDFQSTLDGANTLKIAGNAEFDDEVGAGTKLTSLDITGTTDINTDAIKTTGDQTYEGAATLDAGSTLTSGGLVDFQSTLDGANTLKIAGNAEFDGEVGAGTKLTSLDVTGTTDINTDAIETTGDQTYEGAATLDAGSTLTSGGLVDFQSTLDGANTLKISGNAEFDGEVGAGTKLTSLDITGTTDINTDAIKTTGDQTYEGAATLDAGSTLTSGGLVDFQSTLDGANTLKIAGNAEFDGEVGAGTKLTSLDVTGTTDINTDAIKTTGDQTYEGAATLDAGSTLTSGGLVDFQSTLDGGNTLKIAGNAEFDGEVGAGTKLTSLDVTGTTDINTDAIKTTGDQTYEGAATLSSDTTLTSGGLVDFESTLDGGNTLKIAGNAEFDGEVGVGTELTSLDVTGTTDINTDAITTSGNQTYEGAVTLSSDTNLTSDTGLVNFQSTVDGGQALTVTGAAEFDGEVGVGTKLSSLDVTGTTDINTDAIETTGDQTYEGAATLDAGSTLTSGGLVDFQSTLDGANTLKISGNAEFDGEVGAGTKLTSLDITGTTDINTDAIKTTGDQTYEGAATLDAGSTLTSGGLVDFQSTLDGANTLKIAGNAEFDGEVGVGTELTSLDVTGTTDINTDAIKTTGDQTYEGAVTLDTGSTLTSGGLVDFQSTLDGANTLKIAGNAEFDGEVGVGTELSSLDVTGTTDINTDAIETTGDQTYEGAATLDAGSTLTSGGLVDFQSTLDGANTLKIAGNAEFDGEVGVGTELTSLDVTGTTDINTDAIKTTGDQTYEGVATLASDTTLTSGGLVDFQSTLDGANTLKIAGNAEFDDEVGAGTKLTSLDITGTTDINTDAIKTTGDQTYEGAATLDAGSTLTSGGLVDFQSTLDGANTLKIAGNAEFDGEVGAGTKLTSLDVTGTTDINTDAIETTGDQTYEGAATLDAGSTLTSGGLVDFQSTLDGANTLKISGNAEFDGEVGAGTKLTSLDITGTTDINTDAIKTTGDQTYEGAATLDAGSTLTSGGLVDFQSTLDGANTLKIAGNAEFDGEVGAGTKLTSLDVTGTTDINTDAIKTTGDQTYEGAATLDAGSTLTSGGLVDFQSTLDGGNTLKIAGNAEFDGEVGAGTKLTSLDVTGTTDINTDAIKTTGDQTYEGAATLSSDTTLTSGGLVDFESTLDGGNTLKIAGNAEFDGEVGVGTELTSLDVTGTTDINTDAITTSGNQTYEGAVTLSSDTNLTSDTGLVNFQSTVDGGQALTVTGAAEFDGEVGVGTKLSSLDVTGTTDINTDAIETTGDQTYEGAATLDAGSTLTSGGLVDFQSTLDGANTLKISGNAEFDGEVGAGTKLTSLDITGTTDINTDAIKTTGDQTYEGAATLDAGSTLTSGGLVDFQSTLDGANTLKIAGNAEFDGEVGVGTELTSLDVTGTTDINTDAIKTTGAQTYEGAATLSSDTTLTSGGLVDFQSTVNGAHALTVNGDAEFDGVVGGTTALSSLTTDGASLDLAANVTTANDQSYTVTGNGNTLDVPTGVTLKSNSGGIALETDSPATNITIEGSLSAANGTVTLTSNGTIDESTGAITANKLTGSSVGGATLTGTNSIAQLGTFDNTGSGDFALTDGAALMVVGAVGDQAGDVGDITLTTTGSGHGMTLEANLTSGTAAGTGTVTLDSAGAISQTAGKITAGNFTGYSTGGATLTQTNDVSNLAGFTNTGGVGFSFTDDPALDVTADVNSGTGDLTLTTTGASTNGIILDANLIAGTDAGTQTVTLTSAGAIQQDAPSVITAGNLTGSSVGGTTLTQTNDVSNITGFTNTTSGGISITDDGPLDVKAAIDAGPGDLTLTTTVGGITLDADLTAGTDAGTQTVTLTSAGAITQDAGSVITAGNLTGSSVGGTTLTQTNDVSNITGFTNTTSGGISITDDGPLDVTGTIDAGPGDLTLTTTVGGITLNGDLTAGLPTGSQTITLDSAGSISQASGAITGGTLTGFATGGVSLDDDSNAIGSLGAFTNTGSGGFSLTNGQALNVSGTVDAGAGDLALTTITGEITLNGDIVAGTAGGTQSITLDAAGIISQSDVTITGGVLSGFAEGGISLDGSNAVSGLGNFTNTGSGDITLTVAQALSVTGNVSNTGGNIVLSTTGAGHAMTVTGTLDAGTNTVSLTSAGDFIQNNGLLSGGAVNITAGGNLLIGEAAFTTIVAGMAPTSIDQANTPFFTTSAAFQNYNFIVAQNLSLSAPDRIVVQNTGSAPNAPVYMPHGFELNDPTGPVAVLIGGVPQDVDIFGTLVFKGVTIPVKSIASSNAVAFAPDTTANNHYLLNGCTIHQNGTCTIVNFDFKDFEPAKLAELVLSAAQSSDDVEDDLTITGEGNDEIWAGQ